MESVEMTREEIRLCIRALVTMANWARDPEQTQILELRTRLVNHLWDGKKGAEE